MGTLSENMTFTGDCTFTRTAALPAGSVLNAHIGGGAAIVADKMFHRHKAASAFGLAIGATPANFEEIVFVADRAGTINAFSAILNDTGTTTDVDFDLKKNGVSILTGTVNITHAAADRAVVAGVLSSTTFVAGDVISIQLITTATTGAQGPFAWVELDESPS